MSDLKDIAKTTTKVAVSLLVPGGALAVVGREVYKNCSEEAKEENKGKCIVEAVGAGLLAQGIFGI